MKHIFFVFLIITFSSCIENIVYDVTKENERIVISGLLSDSLENQIITISKSILVNKGATTEATPIINAEVDIYSSDGNTQKLTHNGEGKYSAFFKGDQGLSYSLIVKIDGNIYASTNEEMPDKEIPLTISSDLEKIEVLTSANTIVENSRVFLKASGKIEDNEYFLFRSRSEYEFQEFNPMSTQNKACYVPRSIDLGKVGILSTEDVNGSEFTNYNLLNIAYDKDFHILYCFHVYQYRINENSYNYFDKIKSTLDIGNSLFDPPPGKIIGNIKNINNEDEEVLGNFTVASQNYIRHFTSRGILGGVIDDPCRLTFGQQRAAECFNCLILPGSTSIKPIYWK